MVHIVICFQSSIEFFLSSIFILVVVSTGRDVTPTKAGWLHLYHGKQIKFDQELRVCLTH